MAEGSVVDVATVKVGPDTSRFRQELRAELSKIKETVEVDVDANVDTKKASAVLDAWRKRQEGNAVNIPVNVDRRLLDGAFRAMTKGLKGLGITAVVSAALISATQAATALGQALIAASGAAWLLPGALGAAAAVLGTVMLGMDGIKKAFSGLSGPVNKLKSDVSAVFAKGLLPSARSLSSLIPQLSGGFQQIAKAISGAGNAFTAMLAKSTTVNLLNGLLNSTSTIVRNLGKAFAPFGEGLIAVFNTSASALAGLTTGLTKSANKFRDWATSAKGISDINKWINNGVQALKDLWGLLKNVWGILSGIATAFSSVGATIGTTFGAAAADLNRFFNSAKGQSILKDVARTLVTLADTVRDVLGDALRSIGPALQAALPGLREFVKQIGTVLKGAITVVAPIIKGLFTFLSANMGWVGPLAVGIGAVVLAFKAWTAATNILRVAMLALSTSNPILLIASAILALVPVIIANWEHIKNFFVTTWNGIVAVAKVVWGALTSFFTGLWAAITGSITNSWNGIRNFFTGVWNGISSTAENIFNGVRNFFASVWKGISTTIRNVWNGVRNFFVGLWNGIGSVARSVFNGIRSFFANIWNGIRNVTVSVWNWIRSSLSNVWNGLRGILSGALNGLRSLWNGFLGFVRGIPGAIGRLLNGMWDGLVNGAKAALNGIINVLNGIIDGINYAISGLNILPGVNIGKIPHIPGLETGGTVTHKGTVLVGESGPELLNLPSGAQVTPLTNNDRRTVLGDGSSSDGGIDYARLGAAVAAAMENVRFELDGRPVARAINDQNRVDRRR